MLVKGPILPSGRTCTERPVAIRGQATFRIQVGTSSAPGAELPAYRIAYCMADSVIYGKGRTVRGAVGQVRGISSAEAVFWSSLSAQNFR